MTQKAQLSLSTSEMPRSADCPELSSNNVLANRQILVVEDDLLISWTIEDMLMGLGCRSVTVADTIERAISLADTEFFDAAMLDVNLNGRISFPVADALAARGVPFGFSTGYVGDIDGKHRDRPLLRKPFQFEDLAKVFSSLLA